MMLLRRVRAAGSLVAVCGSLLFQAGCATFFQGRMQNIEVISTPSGSQVYVNGRRISSTPTEIVLRNRKNPYVLRLEKDGYKPIEIKMKRKLSGWVAGEILYGVFISLINYKLQGKGAGAGSFIFHAALLGVDFYSGAAFKQYPPRIDVRLERSESKSTEVVP